jgi:hypothetical protein
MCGLDAEAAMRARLSILVRMWSGIRELEFGASPDKVHSLHRMKFRFHTPKLVSVTVHELVSATVLADGK